MTLWRTFLNGLAVVLPVVLTVAALWWFGASLEHLLGTALRVFLPAEYYVTGLGLVTGVVLVFAVGLALRLWLIRRLVHFAESLLDRIPLAKSVYSSVRDLMRFVSDASDPAQMRKVVLVRLTDDVRLLGFVTQDDAAVASDALDGDYVTVYLQMSYQLGGYTVFVPRDRVTPLDMDMEEAMRWVLTAGMSDTEEQNRSERSTSRERRSPGTRKD